MENLGGEERGHNEGGNGFQGGEAAKIISSSYLKLSHIGDYITVAIYRLLYIGDSRRSLLRRCKASLLIPLPGLFVGGAALKCYQEQLCLLCINIAAVHLSARYARLYIYKYRCVHISHH